MTEKVRRNEVVAREKFFFLRGQIFNRRELVGIVTARLQTVEAVQNFLFVDGKLNVGFQRISSSADDFAAIISPTMFL